MDSASAAVSPGSKRRGKVHFVGEVPIRQDSITTGSDIGTSGISGRTWEETSDTAGGQHMHVLDVETRGFHCSSEEENAATPGPDYRRRSPYIDMISVFGEASGRSLPYHEDSARRDPSSEGESCPEERRKNGARKQKSRENAPEQRITIFALRLALIEKGASQLGTLSFLWATVVILGGFATTVNETDFWVVTLIILAESSRIFSRSHELEWQHLSVRSHESLGRRFLRAASDSYQHNVTFAREVKSKIKSLLHSKASGRAEASADPVSPGSGSAAGPASAPGPTIARRRTSRKASKKPAKVASATKDQTRTWDAPSVQLLPYTHHLVTSKLVSRLLYAVQLLSAIMSIGLAIWRLRNQDFFYNPGNAQSPPPNIKVSMNVFYILSVVEAGLFLLERIYWEYRIRVTQLLQKVNADADLGPDNLLTVKQFFYDVYSQCLKGSVFDGLEMDLVSHSITWLQAEDFKQQLGGARLLNRIVSRDDGKPRSDRFASDCLRRLGTTPGIIERLVEMLSWNSKNEEPLLSEVAVIICRLVVYNRNCSRIVAIPGSIEGIMSLLVPNEWPAPDDKSYVKTTTAYINLRLNGLNILKYLCKDHKNSLKIGEARGLLSILILFIEVRSEKSFSENGDNKFFKLQLKTYKKSLQVLALLAAATNSSGAFLRRRIADVVSGLKNLRDVIEYGGSQPHLQRSSVDILFHLAMDVDVRKTIGATGGVIRNLYNLFASYDAIPRVPYPSGLTEESQLSKRNAEERQLASEMAGKTISRIVLQNEKNCLKVIDLVSDHGEPFLKCMVRFLAKPLETNNAAPREMASCSAQILRSLLQYADEQVKQEVAKDSAQVVLQLIQRRLHEGRSELYESYLGLAPRVLEPLDQETYAHLVAVLSKSELVQQLLKNLKHTPSTKRYPRIRRYSVELLITLINKDNSFLNVLRSININLIDVLNSTMDSISEVENFCLFSGLVGYTRHQEEMETLVARAIQHIQTLDRSWSQRSEKSEKSDH
ncbi:hypothetical protein MPTK1_7g16730 [Marchantia polymorpha subsp. ruderalis]|uniref:Armadillo repeat-containing domain-containing protein n=2 Tax=Marchantia polymorpha TaxID=3197 RepID=A0AAF6C0G5_MARPO|nr:hypothetical protein MARPO_0051s0011 [Marchantia polymorpha]BBN17749.1 hypothetical protein Mp_7g16730 [Marchantia polymorpha subsp. ruderalis]|eukprot:PTQ38375.1 hypothetical protein MARPO_0051s0011 [Marchantia polymorpha]